MILMTNISVHTHFINIYIVNIDFELSEQDL